MTAAFRDLFNKALCSGHLMTELMTVDEDALYTIMEDGISTATELLTTDWIR